MNIISTAETIADIRKRDPGCMDVVTAITLKIHHVKKNSSGALISGIRSVLQDIDDNPHQAGSPTLPDWFLSASRKDRDTLKSFAFMAPGKILSGGISITGRFYADAVTAGYQGSKEELINSFSVRGIARPDPKSEKPFSFQEMMIIDMALSGEDPESAVQSTFQNNKPDIHGLTRIFALSIWATGMRPVELWDCRLMIPIPSRMTDHDSRQMAIREPRKAILEKRYVNVERVTRGPNESIGDVAISMVKSSQAPAILVIKSAKLTNANKDLKSEFRLQVLQDAPRSILAMLGIAAQLRHSDADDKRKMRIRDRINLVLKEIAESENMKDRETISLYSFRHSFATRAKMRLEINEAASLMGHTSKRMTFAYGKRRKTRSVSKREIDKDPSLWIPQPDPEYAEIIGLAWGVKSALESDPSPEDLKNAT